MGEKIDIMSALSEFKDKLSKKIKVQKMVLFGSYATGKYTKDSDIDLLIVSPDFKDKRFIKRSIGFYKFWGLDLPVDYICYTPTEFEKLKKKISLVSMALKEGIVIS